MLVDRDRGRHKCPSRDVPADDVGHKGHTCERKRRKIGEVERKEYNEMQRMQSR